MTVFTFNAWSSPREANYAEAFLVALTMMVLPIFEAPTNVFSVIFIFFWVFNAVKLKSLGRAAPFEPLVFALAVILWVAPFFSEFWSDVNSLESGRRWSLLATFVILVARLDYSHRMVSIIWICFMLGGVLAVGESFWVWSENGKEYPEFRSVGHVNHSSMYTLTVFAAGLGALMRKNYLFRSVGFCAVVCMIAFLPASKSIVGAVSLFVVLFVWLLIITIKIWSFKTVMISFLGSSAVIGVVFLLPWSDGIRDEVILRVSGDNFWSGRDGILRSALAVWNKHPWVGTGFGSFGIATSREAVEAALLERNLPYDPQLYWHFPHGHNLWATMLVERGLIGVFLITALLITYLKFFSSWISMARSMSSIGNATATGALLITVGFIVAGLGNTTMMNEHGMAGMTFLSLSYAFLRARSSE